MDWLFDVSGKSVASNAQRIVADMHLHLERQTTRVRELENIVTHLQHFCTDSLSSEIKRLELRKKELQQELEQTDAAILERKAKLEYSRGLVRQLLSGRTIVNNQESGANNVDGINLKKSLEDGQIALEANESSVTKEVVITNEVSEDDTNGLLDDDFLEEAEMLANVREIEPSFLFLVHKNTSEDAVIYILSKVPNEVVSCYKLSAFNDKSSAEPLSSFERMVAYGPKILENSARDDPNILELTQPFFRHDKSISVSSSAPVGQLVGSIELPVAPHVLIDIWRLPFGPMWASTSVDGVKFAVLERIYVISETHWGIPRVVQVDLFARHPVRGNLLLESVPISS